ncbi:uncharacterized protein MELLADRAFT_69928 [Melampsora larici-populina 98AG31]|uniref:Uncharacterized protein n=1 Tax=Melampsora larici-populina (strain 98AG31 / pathotype 3-4-7) TaxID=747676 RepID=F4SCU3_MELLP|nr:uncharacterized protein MELLADRAFT_69928 [Melampsora larici-populina 98AG31]EGF97525.1 hypothetical protein MELLADRAFT_69928 [Melampsora larici-populina 98AG31]
MELGRQYVGERVKYRWWWAGEECNWLVSGEFVFYTSSPAGLTGELVSGQFTIKEFKDLELRARIIVTNTPDKIKTEHLGWYRVRFLVGAAEDLGSDDDPSTEEDLVLDGPGKGGSSEPQATTVPLSLSETIAALSSGNRLELDLLTAICNLSTEEEELFDGSPHVRRSRQLSEDQGLKVIFFKVLQQFSIILSIPTTKLSDVTPTESTKSATQPSVVDNKHASLPSNSN